MAKITEKQTANQDPEMVVETTTVETDNNLSLQNEAEEKTQAQADTEAEIEKETAETEKAEATEVGAIGYKTADGYIFSTKNDAENYAREIGDLTITITKI